ncbi:MAG TPA: hypothetical protein VJ183_11720 [Chloroflexia bacterium]|nr:hypothetical protein [Chloroflexia bacterium]
MRILVYLSCLVLLSTTMYGCTGSNATPVANVPTIAPTVEATEMGTIAQPTSISSPTPQVILTQLTQADSLKIEDDWTGLSLVAPIIAHYDLRRQNGNFVGTAYFSVAGYREARTATEEIDVPEEAALNFLRMLTQSPAVSGHYEARIEHTDDYPSISIKIGIRNDSFEFFTSSQGEDHVPWGLHINGSTYVINSNQPAKALESLQPYLKSDILEKLIKNEPLGMPETGSPSPHP